MPASGPLGREKRLRKRPPKARKKEFSEPPQGNARGQIEKTLFLRALFKDAYLIFAALIFQIPFAYSLMVLSEENLPELQMLIQHFFAQAMRFA